MKEENYEYELPPDYKDDLVTKSSTASGGMLDPNGKNIYTWIIGILILLCVSAGSALVAVYENILSEKNTKIRLLEDRDCIKELKKSLELQSLLKSELDRVTELKEETEEKANKLLNEHE